MDSDTNEPIDSVYVHKYQKDYGEYTLSDGNFKLSAVSGGLSCPPMTVALSKNGYQTKTEKIENASHKIIKLKKNK